MRAIYPIGDCPQTEREIWGVAWGIGWILKLEDATGFAGSGWKLSWEVGSDYLVLAFGVKSSPKM